MPNFDIPKQYQDTVALTEAILDTSFEYVETFMNTTKLDSTNIQTGGVSSANLASSSVTAAKIDTDAVTTAKILDANITTAKIADLNVTLGKLTAAVQASLVPAGTILATGRTTAPTGYLLCNGAAVSRTTYADLFTAIASAHGSGDGVTTFNVPDYRGRFLRGVDGAQARDPNAATRTAMSAGGNTGDNVGSVQDDAFAAHTHSIPGGTGAGNAGIGAADADYGTGHTSGSAGASTETRPKNAYVNWMIKT